MSAGIAEECDGNAVSNAEILAELARHGAILDELAALLPAMRKAAKFVDNPVTSYREAMKARKT